MSIQPLSVFIGENGVGKSNLYKCLSLLRDAATGRMPSKILRRRWMSAVCWSRLRRRGEDPRLRLEANRVEHVSYSIELGHPGAVEAAFPESR